MPSPSWFLAVYGEEAKKSLPKLHISPCHFTNGENVHAMVSKLKTSIALKEALHQEEDTQQQILSWSKDSAAAVSKIIALTLYG